MKQTLTLALILTLTLTSCGGMGTGQSLIAGGSQPTQQAASQGILGQLLGSVLTGQTTATTLEGTWNYDGPAVKFESENVLSQIGGTLASSKIESLMQTQLTKIGMTKGYTSIAFNKDGQYTLTLKGKTYTGTYTLSGNELTLQGAFGMTHQTCTASIQAGELYMLFDADKLMTIATKVSAANSTLKSLLGSYSGVKLGWKMSR